MEDSEWKYKSFYNYLYDLFIYLFSFPHFNTLLIRIIIKLLCARFWFDITWCLLLLLIINRCYWLTNVLLLSQRKLDRVGGLPSGGLYYGTISCFTTSWFYHTEKLCCLMHLCIYFIYKNLNEHDFWNALSRQI